MEWFKLNVEKFDFQNILLFADFSRNGYSCLEKLTIFHASPNILRVEK